MANVCVWSARHAGVVLLLLLAVTAGFAFGLTKVYVRSADYDLLPDGHPSTIANDHAINEVPGFRSVETIWLETRDHSNITSPAAIRAAEEAEDYIRARVPEINYTYSMAYLVKLVNYTASGIPNPACSPLPVTLPPGVPPIPNPGDVLPPGSCAPLRAPQESAFSLPASDDEIQRDYDIIFLANPGAVKGAVNEPFTGTLVVFMYDFGLTKAGPAAVLPASEKFLHAAEEYRATGCGESALRLQNGLPLVDCDKVYVLGEAINAHMTELANSDFLTFGPIVFVVTLIVLFFAFNDLVSTLIAALSFTLGLVWTYGFMGYMAMPLTFFGLLIVPITLGVGKEYAIYVTNQFQEYVSEGKPREEALRLMGSRAGAALLLASLTSILGVATMALANFFIMRDLAILTCISFASLFVISITFIPAAQALRRRTKRRAYRPSRSMGRLAGALRRHPVLVVAGVLVVTAGLATESLRIEEYFGISGGFKEGDYLETSYRYYNEVLGGSGTELVTIEGNVSDPHTIQYLRDLDASFKADTRTIPKESNVNSLIIALETYYALRDGLLNPAALGSTLNHTNIPTDAAVVHRDIDAMFDSRPWSSLAALFTGRTGNVAVTHVFYHIGSETYDGLKTDWDSLNADIARADRASPGGIRPDSVQDVNLVGTQDTFYLYVTYGQPWLEYVTYMASFITLFLAIVVVGRARDLLALVPGAAAFGLWFAGVFGQDVRLVWLAAGAAAVTLAVLALLRSRDIGAIIVPMLLSGIWWAGLLPLFGIKASLTLMLPTVFLISVGSDYAIQYVWNYRQTGDMRKVYESTGKANLFVVAATVLAFLLFVPMKLVLSSQGALAAALAILVIFVVTTLMVPLFYPA
ncbi:MAG: MMPL family transporter, partial [Halobacteriales archaeon]|nr:MMPL family transporter [Halobacteriales archaeon]